MDIGKVVVVVDNTIDYGNGDDGDDDGDEDDDNNNDDDDQPTNLWRNWSEVWSKEVAGSVQHCVSRTI